MHKFPVNYFTAIEASIEASKEIMRIYELPLEKTIKKDGSPVTSADLASSAIIAKALSKTGIPIIGEELSPTPFEIRKNWTQVWIVDPLDGTKEFIKKNGEFAVNIALVENGEPIFGLITSPVEQTILIGSKNNGAFLTTFDQSTKPEEWLQLHPKTLNNPLVMAGSRSHHSGKILELVEQLQLKYKHLKFIKKGSSLKFFDLAKGEADVYPRFAPTMEWDIASGQAILNELGGSVLHATTNEPLVYNKEDLYNPYFIARSKAFIQDNA